MPHKHYNWDCPWCPMVFPSRHKLIEHKHQEHECMKYYAPGGNCKFCGTFVNKPGLLVIHEKHCNLNPNKIEYKGHPCTESAKTKIKLTNSINHKMGGYREGSGYGLKGKYKGIWCDSSWELAFVIYNLDHNIKFERNKVRFKYTYKGKLHKYIPDFIVNDEYIEIKGRWTEQWQAKLDQFPKDLKLKVLTGSEIEFYINYVISKYGKNFTNLYENKQ